MPFIALVLAMNAILSGVAAAWHAQGVANALWERAKDWAEAFDARFCREVRFRQQEAVLWERGLDRGWVDAAGCPLWRPTCELTLLRFSSDSGRLGGGSPALLCGRGSSGNQTPASAPAEVEWMTQNGSAHRTCLTSSPTCSQTAGFQTDDL